MKTKSLPNAFFGTELLKVEFEGASDRAVAIVAGAHLDEILRELIEAFLVEDKSKNLSSDKKLFGSNGPLGTFSSKIDLAHRLGLLSSGEHRTLHVIRDIRNEFAHQLVDMSFGSQSVAMRCRNIEAPIDLLFPEKIPLEQDGVDAPLPTIAKAPSDDLKAIFQEAVLVLVECLAARASATYKERRASPADYVHAHEMADAKVEALREAITKLKETEDAIASIDPDFRRDAALSSFEELLRLQAFCAMQIRGAHAARSTEAKR